MSQGLCTSCGAAVNLAAGQGEINCTYCGTRVKRPEAEAQFAEVKNSKFGGILLIAETAQEGGSYEEALNYYNKVIEQQPDFADAWLNKGTCTVRTSKIGDLKIPEAISSWKAAIRFAKNSEAMKKRVAKEIAKTVSDFYPVLESHYKKFNEVSGALSEHYGRFIILVSALSLAKEMDSHSELVAKTGFDLCEGVSKTIEEASFFGDAKKITEELDSLADGFLKMKPEAFKDENTKIEAKKKEQEAQKEAINGLKKTVKTLGVWACRILGPLLFLAGIGMLWDAIAGDNQKPDDPGVGGSIVMILLFAGMALYGFFPGKNNSDKKTKK